MDKVNQFFSRVKHSDHCWEWQGFLSLGYGSFCGERSHRWSYKYFVGPISAGKIICHECDNRCCVNPFHLYQGTHKDNSRDMRERGRNHWTNKTHCKNGHEYDEENTVFNSNGSRWCRICRGQTSLKAWHRNYADPEFRKKYRAKRREIKGGEL